MSYIYIYVMLCDKNILIFVNAIFIFIFLHEIFSEYSRTYLYPYPHRQHQFLALPLLQCRTQTLKYFQSFIGIASHASNIPVLTLQCWLTLCRHALEASNRTEPSRPLQSIVLDRDLVHKVYLENERTKDSLGDPSM